APAKANEAAAAPAEKKQTTKEGSEGKKAEEAKAPAVKAAPAVAFSFDNTTDIPDGEYTGDAVTFTFTGGTGKAKLTVDKVTVSGGRATATFTASSANMTHVYLSHTASQDDDPALYDPATGAMGAGVYQIEGQKVTIPVKIGTETDCAVRSVAMTEPHWIQYQYTITVDVPEAPEDAFAFDNSTDIPDGEYTGDAVTFTFTGGTGKAKQTLDKVVVSGGKAMGTFTASSASQSHIYLAHTSSDAEDPAIYDPATDKLGPGVYEIKDRKVTIPVKIGTETDYAVRSVAMTEPHWVNYQYTINVDVPKTPESDFDNSTNLKDGTYNSGSFTYAFEGGTGKARFDLESITVKEGKATGIFKASSANLTHLYLGETASSEEDPALYDPETETNGRDVYTVKDQTVTVPIALNREVKVAGRTIAMSAPHWVNYTYEITIDESREPDVAPEGGTDPEEPKDPVTPSDDKDKDKPETPKTPTEKQTLKNGTYKVLSTTDRKMFYLYPKEQDPAYSILTVKDGKMTATITVTGEGYDYVFMGTPAEAKKAPKSKWIKAKIVNGYYTFTIPVSKLDAKLAITLHSSKYEEDGDPNTDPWRPDKWIKFYSGDAVKIKDGEKSTAESAEKKDDAKKGEEGGGATSGEQTSFSNDNKEDKESAWQDDSSKSTGAVDAGTTLADGVYTPDSFSWSGGSGRLAYIRCNKITVSGGQAYATIEFGSSSYDALKANGRVYSRSGGGNSTFVIPVQLNANNVIIGRTSAMSQLHWVEYVIYVGKAENEADAEQAKEAKKEAAEAKMKISDKAPTILGLEAEEEEEGEEKETYAKYFKIFRYKDGVRLLSIDISQDTELQKEYTENAKNALAASESEEDVEYDEEGKPIARSKEEFITALYKNNVINYLLVPEDYDVPAGLDKEYIIIRVPSEKTYLASPEAAAMMEDLGCLDAVSLLGMDEEDVKAKALKDALKDEKIELAGTTEKPDYRKIIKDKSDLAILPGELLPEEIKKDAKEQDKLKEEAEAKQEHLEKLESRFTALDVPVIVDRSAQEEDELAKAEWIKVYGALYGCEEEADELFENAVKEAKNENN
ncbi:MAG: hypothetical protein IIY84_05125, partial [Eubacterium sp.]|nr:hypothetical protein [Eubacterium sp.]